MLCIVNRTVGTSLGTILQFSWGTSEHSLRGTFWHFCLKNMFVYILVCLHISFECLFTYKLWMSVIDRAHLLTSLSSHSSSSMVSHTWIIVDHPRGQADVVENCNLWNACAMCMPALVLCHTMQRTTDATIFTWQSVVRTSQVPQSTYYGTFIPVGERDLTNWVAISIDC